MTTESTEKAWTILRAIGLPKIFGILTVCAVGLWSFGGATEYLRNELRPAMIRNNTARLDVLTRTQDDHLMDRNRRDSIQVVESRWIIRELELMRVRQDSLFYVLRSLDLAFRRSLCRADGNSAAFCEQTIREDSNQ